ncbi:hypothetical protein [Streptomyces sp. NPDC059881]|uniref:hypothetical protein n=1 Tax=Streptomyces sp. NPDC059881 TaxID=3346986 RepID=UPI003665C756
MSGLAALLKRTWVDWAVFLWMVVTAARSKSPFLVVFFSVTALAAAVIGGRKIWRLVRPAGSAPTRSASEAEAHQGS